jgi:alkyl hydroperoxide reductase subunit AhpC
MLQIGQTAPDFVQGSTEGTVRLHEWLGTSWGVLFSHPRNFTPVCTTELGEVARLNNEWQRRGVKVIGLSVDPLDAHEQWVRDIKDTQGYALNFPLLACNDRKVSNLYGMIRAEADASLTVRSVFIIDPDKKVRLTLNYPPSVGRNFEEILRAIDGLQLSYDYEVSTQVNWIPGEPVIIAPSISDEDAAKKYPQGYTKVNPPIRYVELE